MTAALRAPHGRPLRRFRFRRGETEWTLHVALRESGEAGRADSLLARIAAGHGSASGRARDLLARR